MRTRSINIFSNGLLITSVVPVLVARTLLISCHRDIGKWIHFLWWLLGTVNQQGSPNDSVLSYYSWEEALINRDYRYLVGEVEKWFLSLWHRFTLRSHLGKVLVELLLVTLSVWLTVPPCPVWHSCYGLINDGAISYCHLSKNGADYDNAVEY